MNTTLGTLRAAATESIGAALDARVHADPDEPIVKCGGEWLTTSQVRTRALAVAGGLETLGLARGDRLAVMLPNCQEMLEIFFACAYSGVILVPLNPFLKGEFLGHQLRDCGARLVITDRPGYDAIAAQVADSVLESLVLVDEAPSPSIRPTVPYAMLGSSGATLANLPDVGAADLVSILYTSGTTGLPKGCMLSNGYYLASPRAFWEMGWIEPGDRIISPLALYHGAAHAVLMWAVTVPHSSVCFEPQFSAKSFMARAKEERATIFWGLGPMAGAILAQPESRHDKSTGLRSAILPALPWALQKQFEQRFDTAVAGNMFGQTECLGVTIGRVVNGRGDATIGAPARHVEVLLVDDDDNEVAVGDVGEIVVRPRVPFAIYSGYWQRPDATVEAWSNLWHHTGDSGRMDESGNLTFIDRKRDSLRRRGENVSSFELESAIMRFPKIARVAVCAVPSTLGDGDIKACIVLRDGEVATPEELFEHFSSSLPYFAVPRYVEIRESLPTTPATDRVQKHVLRAEGVTSSTWDLESMGLTVDKAARR